MYFLYSFPTLNMLFFMWQIRADSADYCEVIWGFSLESVSLCMNEGFYPEDKSANEIS